MAVRVRRAHLSADHAVRGVSQFVDILRFNRLGEAGPAASRIKLVGRREQRLAGHDIDVDARFLVIQIFSGSGGLGAVFLRYVKLLGRELSNRVVVLAELSHLFSLYRRYTKVLLFSITLCGMGIIDDDLDRMDRDAHICEASACDREPASTAAVPVMNFVGISGALKPSTGRNGGDSHRAGVATILRGWIKRWPEIRRMLPTLIGPDGSASRDGCRDKPIGEGSHEEPLTSSSSFSL